MNQKGFINILLLALVIILAGVVGYLTLVKKLGQPTEISTPTPISTSTPTPTPISQGQLYENQYMKITIPAGWTVTQATETVYVEGVPQKRPNPAAVNITKNNYILYINTQAQQASGIVGGRFSEIAQGAPSVDAVIKMHPSSPCGFSETNPGFPEHPRVDLYVNNQENREWCTIPSGEATVWYFSYITNRNGSYFNYYKEGEPLSFVITMAYNSRDVNKLPVKGSAQLNSMLNEMTAIIKTLEIKYGFFAIKQAQKISEIESDEGKTKLTIRTNKNEYKQGEIVEIFIKNNGLKPIWYNKETCPPFCCWLQKLENGKWKDFKAIGTVVVDLRVRPSKLNPGEEISRKWSTTKKENGREISMIEPGIYRIAFNYGLTKDSFNEKTIYSNEFIIK